MGIQIIKGSRSERFAAKDWSCVCGTVNKAKSFLFFDLPPFTCENRQCGRVYDGIIYFNLADIEVNGKSLLPGIKSQGQRPECIPYAFGHAQELNDIVENIILGDDSPIEVIDPMILAETYRMMFGPHINNLENPGAHKILYTALILKDYGRKAVKDKLRSTRSDAVTVNSSKAEHICQCIADGRAVVATIAVGKHLRHLKFGEVYVPPETKYDTLGHAVVLIGAIFHQLRIIYFFLNSWGEQFCAFYDENGKLVMSGVGMVEGKFLMYNPVVLTRSWEEGTINGLFGSWMWYETASEREVDVDCIMETPNLMPTFTRKKFDVCAYDDESLKYRLLGSEEDFGSWGHEYARNLAGKIAQEFQKRQDDDLPIDALMELMQKFVSFQKHNAETEAVDLLMEVEDLDLLVEHVDATNYKRACLYLSSLSRYLPAPDDMLALDIAYTIYMKFGDLVIALIIALQLDKLLQYVKQVFTTTDDLLLKKQFAHVIARHGLALEIDDEIAADDNDKEILQEIVNNTKLSEGYLTLARDIEVMEPKSPEDMYKVNVMGTLSRLSHGADADVSMAAIISLGLIGAGTNNARIAGMLRDLSSYYYKEAAHLFC